MQLVVKPTVPSTIRIPEPLDDGCKIDLHGRVLHGRHKNFAVQLLSGPHIVLQVNFRFHNEHMVVMNSCNKGVWGPEVRLKNPLHHDNNFLLYFHVKQSHIDVEVNGLHLAAFVHRFPVKSIGSIGLKGDVYVEKINCSRY